MGSVGAAFIVIFLLGKLILQTGDFTYIVFLAVYGVDSVLTICHRIVDRTYLFTSFLHIEACEGGKCNGDNLSGAFFTTNPELQLTEL